MQGSLPISSHRQSRLSIAIVLLVLLLLTSFGLRIVRLGDKSVWWDEGLAAWSARQSLSEIAQWTSADVHPPLYFWMLHYWRLGSGDSEFGLRFLSVAIGALTVAAVYLLGRETGGLKAGLLAALLVGISRFDIWWSQEMRMYALAALLAALSLWATVRFWERERLSDGVLYVLFTTAGLYTLYLYASLLVVANLIWLGVLYRARHRRQTLLRWAAAQAAVLILFAPWLNYALGRIPTWSSASPVSLDVFLRIYWTMLTLGIPISVESYGWLTIPVLIIFLAGLATLLWQVRLRWQVGRDMALLLASLLLPAGVVYVVSLPRNTFFYSPQLAPRYLLIFAPAFYVLMAWGLARISQIHHWLVGAVLTVAVVGAAAFGLWGYYPGRIIQDDYKSLVATLHTYQHQGDEVLLYTDKDWPVFAYHHPGSWRNVPHAQTVTPAWVEPFLSPIWNNCQGVWLVVTPYAGVNDPQGQVPDWLAAHAAEVIEHRFSDKVLRFYARTKERARTARDLSPAAPLPRNLNAELTGQEQLIGFEQAVETVQSGDTLHVFLYWQGRGDAQAPGSAFELDLADAAGRVLKRQEATVPVISGSSIVRQQIDVVLPPDTEGGRYRFTIRPLPGGDPLSFGRVVVPQQQRAALTAADVDITHPNEIDFGDGVRLLGYDVAATTILPGEPLYLTLYWQATQPVEHRYKVFTHLLGEVFNARNESFIWGQQDNEPASNTRPTSTWRPGEVIVDSYAIALEGQAPEGQYTVEIGLYDPATQLRLPVLDKQGNVAADHLRLTAVRVDNQ